MDMYANLTNKLYMSCIISDLIYFTTLMKKTSHNSTKSPESRKKDWESLYRHALADLTRIENDKARATQRAEDKAVTDTVKEFLSFADDLEIAVKNIKHNKQNNESLQIISMLKDKLENIFKLLLIEKIATAKGQLIDPVTCEVVGVTEGKDDGRIVEVVSYGYKVKDLIVRPSRVIVSKRSLAK